MVVQTEQAMLLAVAAVQVRLAAVHQGLLQVMVEPELRHLFLVHPSLMLAAAVVAQELTFHNHKAQVVQVAAVMAVIQTLEHQELPI
jgi:hypothetical protein